MSKVSLFEQSISVDKQHPQFISLLNSEVHRSAREYIDNTFQKMGDPNGKFSKYFQGSGFHSRLFELACFAYLEECGLKIDRNYETPDFIGVSENVSVAFECVTANPSSGQKTDISLTHMVNYTHDELMDKIAHEVPKRLGRILWKKLNHRYQGLPHCQGLPLVLAIAPFFEGGSLLYTDHCLVEYLYGSPEGDNSQDAFFGKDSSRHISAVLFCNRFTVSKFLRLSTNFRELKGYQATLSGCAYQSIDVENYRLVNFSKILGDSECSELWSEGVTLYENPNSSIPLEKDVLKCSSRIYVEDGYVCRDVHGFHPLSSGTIMRAVSSA